MSHSTIFWIIIASAVLTYLTRVGGHLVLSRFDRIHPRVEAALSAVPAGVLTTLVAPAAFTNGLAEFIAIAAAALVSIRFGGMAMFVTGAALIIILRQLGM
ncbi:MAG: AzlD family protein [Phyllobacterium sp.]